MSSSSSLTELPKKRFSRLRPSSPSQHHIGLTSSQLKQLDDDDSLSTTSSPLKSHGSSTLNEENNKEIRMKTAELSSLFIGIRKSLMNGLNADTIDNSENGNDIEQLFKEKENHHLTKKFSPNTLVRAERVKFTIGLYYIDLKRQIELKRLDPETHELLYPGVEGVYNPLQVIRDRKLFKKYKQNPRILDLKIITPASHAFSENKKRRLKWQVDLNEMVHDFNFRSQHFHELKNPQNKLWFPQEHHKNGRLHEKLFDYPTITIEDDEGRVGRSTTKSTSSRSSSKKSRFSKSPHKLFKNVRNSGTDLKSMNEFQSSPPDRPLRHNSSSSSSSNILLSPIKSVNIKSVKKPKDVAKPTPVYNEVEDDQLQLSKQFNLLKKMRSLITLAEHEILNKPIYLNNKLENLQNFKLKELNKIHSSFDNFNNDIIKFENHLNKIDDCTTDYKTHLSNTYSNKIDVLLSLSDRTIGEINTSMTLETRRLRERLEKLDSNLYSSLTSDNKNDLLINSIYYVLENLIGMLLLIIWFVYKIFRIFKIGWLGIWKMINWLIK